MSVVTSQFNYNKIKEIGSGNFGKVHLIDDPQLGGQFAAKEIPIEDFEDNAFASLFSEAQKMHAASCPHVMQVRSAAQNDEFITLVMAYFENGSLDRRIKDRALCIKDTFRIGQEILSGLAHIHRADIIHFDLKPSNIIFDDYGRAMVSDFGQAQLRKAGGFADAPPMYLWSRPPEVLESMVGSSESDIYQTGLTLYRAINGEQFYREQANRYPCDSEENVRSLYEAIRRGKFPDRSKFQPHVPESFRRVIRKSMNVSPEVRYHDAEELADALSRIKITLDWNMDQSKEDIITWTASRDEKMTYKVNAVYDPCGISVEVFTESDKGIRRKRPGDFCKTCSSAKEVDEHLRFVFNELS